MANPLINSRDRFCKFFPEKHHAVAGRTWGAIQAGNNGPALVLLPGTLGRADIFWHQIDALQNQCRILALSYPDTGGIVEWADDIAALMDLHQMNSATVLGSSLGGYLAQYFAAVYPAKTDRLIAANTLHTTAILADIPPYNADIDNLPEADLMQGFTKGLQDWAEEEPSRQDLVALLLQEVTGRIPTAQLRARLNALKRGPALPPIPLATSQVFTVESGDDRLIPPPVRAAVRARLNPCKTRVFEQGSHFPYITEPKAYTAMIADILQLPAPAKATR